MTDLESLAIELRSWLIDHEMWMDVTIFFEGKSFSTCDDDGNFYYNDPDHLLVLFGEDPHCYTKYAGDLLTMIYEGPLYNLLNRGMPDPDLISEFDAIFDKYGYYWTQGHAWDLTIHKKGS